MVSQALSRADGMIGNVAHNAPCRVATTANITLAGLQTIDDVTLAAGDRVVVRNQTNTTQNGIYTVAAGSWTRSLDCDGPRDVVKGTLVFVNEGTVNATSYWRANVIEPVTFGSSAFAWDAVALLDGGAAEANDAAAVAVAARDAAIVARDAAAASYDSFDDRYLGSKAANPTVDNDAAALLTGALYWNSVSSELRLWNGAAWVQVAFTVSGSYTGSLGVDLVGNDFRLNAEFAQDLVATLITGTTGIVETYNDAGDSEGLSIDKATAANYRAATADKFLDAAGAWAAADYVALTDAATVAVDMGAGINFTLLIEGDRTLGLPTNMKAGQSGAIIITQGAAGGPHTLAYNAAWKFAGGSDPVLSTAADTVDILTYLVLPGATTVLGNLLKAVA